MSIRAAVAFGTFDILHSGHIAYLKRAKHLGKKLVVVVSRDANAKKVKGSKPVNSEQERLKLVKELRVVDNAVLGSKKDMFSIIFRLKPAFVALGYDQKADLNKLKSEIKKRKLKTKIVRIKIHIKHRKSSSIKRKIHSHI